MPGGGADIPQDLVDEPTRTPGSSLSQTGCSDKDRPGRHCPPRRHTRVLLQALVAGPGGPFTGRLPTFPPTQTVSRRAALGRRATAVVPLRGHGAPVHRIAHISLSPVHSAPPHTFRARRLPRLCSRLLPAGSPWRLCAGTRAPFFACGESGRRSRIFVFWLCRLAH